jgi:serralysin
MPWGQRPVPNPKPVLSWDEAAERITHDGVAWHDSDPLSQTTITFGFLRENEGGPIGGYSAAMKAQARLMLDLYKDVANVVFVEVSDGADGNIAWGNYTANIWLEANDFVPAGGVGGLTVRVPNVGEPHSGVAIVPNGLGGYDDLSPDTYAYKAVFHEIGHALGFSHPGDYNAGVMADYDGDGDLDETNYVNAAEYAQDSGQYTIMSYFGPDDTGANHTVEASTLLLHDIAAIQRLYGARTDTRTGDTVYGFNSNSGRSPLSLTSASDKMVAAIYDNGGIDTLDFSGYSQTQTIDLNQEAFSSTGGLTLNVSIARGAVIENAKGGSGSDTLLGNGANNRLEGNAGADTLVGRAGIDSVFGGSGDDTLFLDISEDIAGQTFDGGAGAGDKLALTGIAPASFDLRDDLVTGIEILEYSNAGGADVIVDVQVNATQLGGVTAVRGNFFTNMLDRLTVTMGTQTNLSLLGTTFTHFTANDRVVVNGDADSEAITGGSARDILNGNGGGDFLSGGAGIDELHGGGGDDTLALGSSEDIAGQIFDGGAGTGDELLLIGPSPVSFDLRDDILTDVEILRYGNVIDGSGIFNAHVNASQLGGVGDLNTISGFFLDSAQDHLTVTMGAQTGLNLLGTTFTDFTDNDRVIVNGDADAESITGSTARDVLNGGGGADWLRGAAGRDELHGGTGDDVLSFADGDNLFDIVDGGADFDTVQIEGLGIHNFNGSVISGIERIDFNVGGVGLNKLAAFEAAYVGAGLAANLNVVGDTGGASTLLLQLFAPLSVDISAFTFANWGIDDRIELYGDNASADGETFKGSTQNDRIFADAGADIIDGYIGADAMTGGLGNDIFYVDNAGDTVIELAGAGSGTDSVRTSLATYTLAANVERLYKDGTSAYTAVGNASNNTIYGNNGDDKFRDYNLGTDAFSGGNGVDSMYYSGTTAAILNFATNVHGGSAAGDAFASVEKFFGSITGNDQMTAGAARATFNGQGGNDTLTGGANHDKLYGEAGADILSGGGGNDQLYGGLGNDTMTGGALRDDFVYTETAASGGWGTDTVTDFQDGLDVLKFANSVADAFSDFTITGNGTANVLVRLAAAPANSIALQAAGPITLSAADFLFY